MLFSGALRKIRQDPVDEAAWKLFFLLPRMLLCPMSRGGQTNSKEVKSLFNNFLEFHWKSLVHLKENNCGKAIGMILHLNQEELPYD